MQPARRLSLPRAGPGAIWIRTIFCCLGWSGQSRSSGKAASRVSLETRVQYPGIPWKAIVGTRNKVIHDYVSVDHDILWDTVQVDLPGLIAQLEEIVRLPDNEQES